MTGQCLINKTVIKEAVNLSWPVQELKPALFMRCSVNYVKVYIDFTYGLLQFMSCGDKIYKLRSRIRIPERFKGI